MGLRARDYLTMTAFALRLVPLYASARIELWRKARIGRRAFTDELRRQGLSEEAVKALERSYSKMVSDVTSLFSWRGHGPDTGEPEPSPGNDRP